MAASVRAKFAAAAAGAIVALLGAEGLVRLVAPQPALLFAPGMYVPDDTIGHRHQPGHHGFLTNVVEYRTRVDINEFGLRGPSVSDRSDRIRILMLGDSFVFGQGVEAEDSLTERLRVRLAEQNYAVEVLNAGVRGYGTAQEADWLKEWGQRLRPDVVVLGVFLGNDLQDDATLPALRLQQVTPRRFWHTPVSGYLYEHSHLYRATRAAVLRISGSQQTEQLSYLLANYGVRNDPERAFAGTARAIDELVRGTQQLNAKLIAILIPDRSQVEAPGRDRFAQIQHSHAGLNLDLENPNRIYTRLLADRGVPCVDLTKAFQARSKQSTALYLPIDGHLTVAGHQLAADLMTGPMVDVLRGLAR